MLVISPQPLRAFWKRKGQGWAEQPLKTWLLVTRAAAWTNPVEVKATFNSADPLKGGRVVFDIGGNKCRLVCFINYKYQVVYVKFVGTHKEYDAIDVEAM